MKHTLDLAGTNNQSDRLSDKQKSTEGSVAVITALLVLLYTYTVMSKLSDISEFRAQMFNQAFSHQLAIMLLYLVPSAEILAITLLLSSRYRIAGFILSVILMACFTGYVALVLLGFYERVPCSCGGVLKSIGWGWHLVLNTVFWLLSLAGLLLTLMERRPEKLTE